MKKRYVLSAFALLLIACGKETETLLPETPEEQQPGTEQPEQHPIVFHSKAVDDGTKVEINGFDLKFSTDEKIAVASYNYASETSPICSDYATFDDQSGTITEACASGDFIPHTTEYGSGWAGAASAISFYSYYPYSEALSISGTTATVTNLAATQDGTVNNIVCWAKGSTIASAAEVTAGNAPSFAFTPVCALLKLTIQNNSGIAASISDITLRATGGNISGDASLNLLTGALSGGSSTSVAYHPASALGVDHSGSQTIYLGLIPNASITDWTISITDSRGTHFLYEYSLNNDLPAALLPGRLYDRTITISGITGVATLATPYTYNGVKFVRGFLKRSENTTTEATKMSISDATSNPFELIDFARATDDSYKQMYFANTDLNTIFNGTSGTNFDSNSIQIGEHYYKVPSKTNYETITKTAAERTSNKPTINSTPKAWALVMVTLSDSKSATGTEYKDLGFQSANTTANYLRGFLFFPDSSNAFCSYIDNSKCDALSEVIWGNQTTPSPNTITTTQLMTLINGGCLFLPAIGGRNGSDSAFVGRGNTGYYWSSTYKSTTTAWLWMFSQGQEGDWYYYRMASYASSRIFPVALVNAN